MSGQVYFIECAGRIKVGFSASAETRIKELSTAAPTKPTMIGYVSGGRRLENAIHAKLKPHRDHREWFTDCTQVRELIADVMVRGAAALGISDEPAQERQRDKPKPQAAAPGSVEWWEVAVKGMTAIFNRYEYTILNHPDKIARRTAFVVLQKAQDSIEGMVDRSADHAAQTSDAMAKIQKWLAGVETQLSAAVSSKGAR